MFLIESSNCGLRFLASEDIPHLVGYMEDEEVTRHFRSERSLKIKDYETWLKAKAFSKLDYLFAIFRKNKKAGDASGQHLIGISSLHIIDEQEGAAEGGTIIGDKRYWGTGIARESKILQLNYAFSTQNLRKVYAIVSSKNIRTRRFVLRLGYEELDAAAWPNTLKRLSTDQIVYLITRCVWLRNTDKNNVMLCGQ